MLFILALILLVVCIIVGTRDWASENLEATALFVGLISGIILLVGLIVSISSYSESIKLQTFYDTNYSLYQQTLSKSESLLSDPQVKTDYIVGSLEKTKLASDLISLRVELAAKVADYNLNLTSQKAYSSNFWIGLAYPPVPDRLKLLSLP